MSQDSFPGGRAKKAPYLSTHIRVPDTIKNQLARLAEIYRKLLVDDNQVGLGNFDLQLNKFIEGHNPLYGVVADDFKLVDTKQFEELKVLYDLACSNRQQLRDELTSLKFRNKEAAKLLQKSLKLRANAGGAIKEEIKKALGQMGEDF